MEHVRQKIDEMRTQTLCLIVVGEMVLLTRSAMAAKTQKVLTGFMEILNF